MKGWKILKVFHASNFLQLPSITSLNINSPFYFPIHVTSKCLQNRLLAQIRNPLVEQIHFFISIFQSRWKEILSSLRNWMKSFSSRAFDINSIAHNRIIELSKWVREGERRAKFPHHLNDIIANWNIEKISSIFFKVDVKFLDGFNKNLRSFSFTFA